MYICIYVYMYIYNMYMYNIYIYNVCIYLHNLYIFDKNAKGREGFSPEIL